MKAFTITVFGIPQPQGSKIAGFNRKTGKSFVRDDNENLKPWRRSVALAAAQQYAGPLLTGAIWIEFEFLFPRPKYHFGTGKNANTLKASAPYWHTVKPDLMKICRSTEDSMTGIVYTDDSQHCAGNAQKRYCNEGEHPGVIITIRSLEA